MRRGLIALALVTAMAGLAAANILPAPAPSAAASTSAVGAPPRSAPPASASRLAQSQAQLQSQPSLPQPKAAAALPSAAPTLPARSIEARQAPVPFQMAARPSFVPPPEPDPAADKAAKAETGESNEGAAKAAIMADGYKAVRGLTKAADGTWRGRALRGTTEIQVTVDAQGRVSAD